MDVQSLTLEDFSHSSAEGENVSVSTLNLSLRVSDLYAGFVQKLNCLFIDSRFFSDGEEEFLTGLLNYSNYYLKRSIFILYFHMF